MKIKKIIIVVLLLLVPVLMAGCGKDAQVAEGINLVPTATELTDEQYILVMMDSLGETTGGFQQLANLLEEPNKDASWEDRANFELEKIRTASLEYLELQNVPEKYAKVHEHVTQAMLYNVLAADAYPVKSADQSVESYTIAADYITKGTASIVKAGEELDKIK